MMLSAEIENMGERYVFVCVHVSMCTCLKGGLEMETWEP